MQSENCAAFIYDAGPTLNQAAERTYLGMGLLKGDSGTVDE